MKDYNLKSGNPQMFTLAADWRLGEVSYPNDIIWELNLEGGDPSALALQTTFGLRASGMRIFPCFIRKDGTIIDPLKFHHPPVVQQLFPNYARVMFSPFLGVEVQSEYQVVTSASVCGRFTLHNKSILKEHFRFELVGLLNPLGTGQGMAGVVMENNQVLEGGSGKLSLICCLGSPAKPGSGPFASLGQEIDLFPNSQTTIGWALAAAGTSQEAFKNAQSAVMSRFDAATARIQLMNETEELEIYTGNPEWDAALMYSQRSARRLFFPASGGLPCPSFVQTRRQDQGHSITGDGSDYPSTWSGQTVLDSIFISSLLLPGGMSWVKGLVRNFLATQDETGQVDWRPGLAGQRSRRLAQPMLASLALAASELTDEREWLKEIYPGLARFIRNWFSVKHDRDQDGFPEWDHALQTGLEVSSMYDRWYAGSQGLDLNVLESPALGAMLVRECRSLCIISRLLGAEDDIPWLEAQANRLTHQIQETWEPRRAIYHYRDQATHSTADGEVILEFSGSQIHNLSWQFSDPQRLMYVIHSVDQATRNAVLKVSGYLGDQVVGEEIKPQQFAWVNGQGRATGRQIFSQVARIEVTGVMAEDQGWVKTPDYTLEDLSLLLPLWAGIPEPEQARMMVEKSIFSTWLDKYGLSSGISPIGLENAEPEGGVLMPWNHLIGEGLLNYGFRKEAAELIRRLMEGIVINLRSIKDQQGSTELGGAKGLGEAGHLHRLAPVGLFLRTAGIHQLTPGRLILQIGCPFSHAITVKYKGTTVILSVKEAHVTFGSGQTIRLDEPGLHQVQWQ